MKRIVDIFTNEWTPEIVWTYIITLEGNENPVELNRDELDLLAFENEAIRLAVADGRGTIDKLVAKVRE